MNVIKINKKLYKYESFWRNSKKKIIYDYNNDPLPWPKERDVWQNQQSFIKKLVDVQNHLMRKKNFISYEKEDYKNCLICHKKKITTGLYGMNNIRWEDGLLHYVKKHNIKPSDEFLDLIFMHEIRPKIERTKIGKMKVKIVTDRNKKYLKLERNQINIMDALMIHGSYRQYVDKEKKTHFRYSEHAGLLDFDDNGLEKIIISGQTNRVDENDNIIFLPSRIPDAYDYEYIFHTHPATPTPGGRAVDGILYEFPSLSDVFHFIDHYNNGETQGSIIIAAEGMYIIRKKVFDNKKIKIDEDKFFREFRNALFKIEDDAIKKYGIKFKSSFFYSTIAQDKKYINRLNKVLNKYKLHIDFYSRIKDSKGKWIIDTVYLPIYVIEPDFNIA